MILPGLPFGLSGRPKIKYVGGRTDAFPGTTSTRNISLTSLSGGTDSAPKAGDLVVLFYGASRGSQTLSVSTSGYQSLPQINNPIISGRSARSRLFYKIMGAVPDTSVTVSGTGNVEHAGGVVILVFRNVSATTPLDVSEVTAFGGTAIANPPAVTPVSSGAVVVAFGAAAHNRGTQTFTSSDLSGFITAGAEDSDDVTVGGGFFEWVSGTFDPAAFGFSGSIDNFDSWNAHTIALRPK